MMLQYLYSKFFKKVVRGKSILKSMIDKTSVVGSGSSVFNTTMDRYSYCGYDCDLYSCDIGSFCSISDHVFIGGAEHPANWASTSPVFQATIHSGPSKRFARLETESTKRTVIGADVWIGHNVTVKQGVHIGIGVIIGAGAVVTKDIPPYAIVAGCPARIIRFRFPQEMIDSMLDSEWWKLSEDDLKSIGGLVNNPKEFLNRVFLIKEKNYV